ncbi:hypothetical protein NDU88_004985 [Pleurodeles waltl]|uniref:Uncharacterized protein n=1 Tax=Pleurodeles waltl TaxID=8319 RepID=A0AAV7LK79_PLEWA|nr:hypothetical protein NDU88_004985 [Pleurodeles waltl]
MGCVRRWRVSRRKVKWTHLWSVQCKAEEWLKDTWLLAEKMGLSVCPAMWVFGGEGGVFGGGGDVDGVLEDDGDSSSYLVGAVFPGNLVAFGDGYGDVGGRGGVHPGLSDEGDVWCGGVQEDPNFNGVLVDGACVDQDAFEVVDGAWAGGRGVFVVEGEFTGVTYEGSVGTFRVGLEAGAGAPRVEGVEGDGVVAVLRGLGVLGARGRGAGRGPGAGGRRQACLWCREERRTQMKNTDEEHRGRSKM